MSSCEQVSLAFNFIRSRSKSTTSAPRSVAQPRVTGPPQSERLTENSPMGPSIAVPSRASRPSGLWNGLPLGVSCWRNLMGGKTENRREETRGRRQTLPPSPSTDVLSDVHDALRLITKLLRNSTCWKQGDGGWGALVGRCCWCTQCRGHSFS